MFVGRVPERLSSILILPIYLRNDLSCADKISDQYKKVTLLLVEARYVLQMCAIKLQMSPTWERYKSWAQTQAWVDGGKFAGVGILVNKTPASCIDFRLPT